MAYHWNYLVVSATEKIGVQAGQFVATNYVGELDDAKYYWGEYQADSFLPGPQAVSTIQNELAANNSLPTDFVEGRFLMMLTLSYLGEY